VIYLKNINKPEIDVTPELCNKILFVTHLHLPYIFFPAQHMQKKRWKRAVICSCFKKQEMLEAAGAALMRSYNEQGFRTLTRCLLLHVSDRQTQTR